MFRNIFIKNFWGHQSFSLFDINDTAPNNQIGSIEVDGNKYLKSELIPHKYSSSIWIRISCNSKLHQPTPMTPEKEINSKQQQIKIISFRKKYT